MGTVYSQNAQAYAVGDDGQAVALGTVVGGKHACSSEKLRNGLYAQHACTTECAVENLIAVEQAAGCGQAINVVDFSP